MKINIVNFAGEKGKEIANTILLKHDAHPYLLGNRKKTKSFLNDFIKGYREAPEVKKMEKEISKRAYHETTIFFLKNGDLKFDTEINRILIQHLSQRAKIFCT